MTTFLLAYIIVMLAAVISVIIGAMVIIKKYNIKLNGGSDGLTANKVRDREP